MSNALAIASVTAVLVNLMENALTANSVSQAMSETPLVTAVAPDLIKADTAVRLNLFLYHVEPNGGWRNLGQPSRDGRGARLTNPPLALDLNYLLTAYGKESYEAEILLGYAMQLLNEWPVLTREAIRNAVASISGGASAALKALKATNLDRQIEQVKITPRPVNTEESSKLWSALQSNYRPSAAYQVSVVLIESEYPAASPLPVLTRGPQDAGVLAQPDLTPPFPTLISVEPPNKQLSARLGEDLTLTGFHLDGDSRMALATNLRLPAAFELTPTGAGTATGMEVKLEADPANDAKNWVAGVYTASAVITKGGVERTTNELPFTLAPRINSIGAVRGVGDKVTVSVECIPDVRPLQRATLVVGSREILSGPHPNQTKNLTFVDETLAPGTYRVRLRVDGAESLLIDRSKKPPVFITSQPGDITEVTVP